MTDSAGAVLRELAGAAYPYRDGAGAPIIPGVLYHAADAATLVDWQTGTSVALGAVRLMVFYTSLGHVINDASWQQRWGLDVEFAAAAQMSADGRTEIVADPATVLQATSAEGKQGTLGAFPQPSDPEAIMRVIAMYARQLQATAGVQSPEASRNESDIRSGYSLAVSREAVREMQATFAPTFRRGDQQILHVAASLMGEPSPEPEAWTVEYQSLAMSPQEISARMAAIKEARSLGLMSRSDAILFLHPQLSVEEAQARVLEIDAEAAEPTADPTTNLEIDP